MSICLRQSVVESTLRRSLAADHTAVDLGFMGRASEIGGPGSEASVALDRDHAELAREFTGSWPAADHAVPDREGVLRPQHLRPPRESEPPLSPAGIG